MTSNQNNNRQHSPINFDPATRSATRTILETIGASPNRTLGQNFLTDKNALDRIIALADLQSDDFVLEIGPGLGALTCRLVQNAGHVVAIEKDKILAQFLPSQFSQFNQNIARFSLIEGDALDANWDALSLPNENVKVVANLPYSISKPFLRLVYETWRPHLQSATLMLQKEVAQRLVAAPSTPSYGPMAIMAALYGETKIAFNLAPGAFWPPPEVSSSVVQIRLLETPSIELEDEKFFWQVVRAAFGQRRKQLINTLRAAVPDKEALQSALKNSNIDPQRRGETLSLQEFALLSKNLKSDF